MSAASTRGLQPTGQVMPEIARVRLGRSEAEATFVKFADAEAASGAEPCCPHPRKAKTANRAPPNAMLSKSFMKILS